MVKGTVSLLEGPGYAACRASTGMIFHAEKTDFSFDSTKINGSSQRTADQNGAVSMSKVAEIVSPQILSDTRLISSVTKRVPFPRAHSVRTLSSVSHSRT
jgi:hypothetical protein